MNIQQLRREIINHVIKIEGGYVNDRLDSGGETKYGVTKAVANKHGIYDVQRLTVEQAYQIYESDYWHPLNLDQVAQRSPDIAQELFDSGVNMGTSRAAKFLQRSLNALNNDQYPDVEVDGVLGNASVTALNSFFQWRGKNAEATLLKMLNGLQSAFYIELAERRPKDERFQYGWQKNRVDLVDAPDADDEYLSYFSETDNGDIIPVILPKTEPVPGKIDGYEPEYFMLNNDKKIPVFKYHPPKKSLVNKQHLQSGAVHGGFLTMIATGIASVMGLTGIDPNSGGIIAAIGGLGSLLKSSIRPAVQYGAELIAERIQKKFMGEN